jgi:AcrR family transcriptional regulator
LIVWIRSTRALRLATISADRVGHHWPVRVDAVRNRERLLKAAREVFVEQGVDVPLEDIVKRVGVGIATLYRRFPDRVALMRAVALHVLVQVAAEARARWPRRTTASGRWRGTCTEPSIYGSPR